MLVLCTVIYIEVVDKTTTERALGEHALYGVTDDLVHAVRTLAKLSGSVEALSTRISSITCVDLVCLLLTSEDSLSCVDDDNVVSTVYVRSEVGLVLSADELCYLRAETTYYLVCGIDYFLAVSLLAEIVL